MKFLNIFGIMAISNQTLGGSQHTVSPSLCEGYEPQSI